MIAFDSTSIDQGAKQLRIMQAYKPFEYSGKWFLVQKEKETICARTKKAAIKHSEGKYPVYIYY